MNTQVAITHRTTETVQAAIAGRVPVAHAPGMRIATPGTLRYHSISCACEQCIRVDERIASVSPPITIAFDADPLCDYYEFHQFMHVELRCGFSKGHTSKHYDYRHRMKF